MSNKSDMFCSYCYKDFKDKQQIKKCSKCLKRIFCSKECQTKDWKIHKLFCRKSGELNIDLEIKKSKYGMGIFAKKDFNPGDIIYYERPIINTKDDLNFQVKNLPHNIREKINLLTPLDKNASILHKFNNNWMSDGTNKNSVLCLLLSRINHHCIGNSKFSFVCLDRSGAREENVMIIQATHNIKINDEITFSYLSIYEQNRVKQIHSNWNFNCSCDDKIHNDIETIASLDDQLLYNIERNNISETLEIEKKLLSFYDKHKLFTNTYSRTYYDMYQLFYKHNTNKKLAKEYLNKALEQEKKYNFIKTDFIKRIEFLIKNNK